MSNKQNLIFEPEDLEVASPATVSRCGMIYMEPHQLGWRPHFESYMNTLPDSINEENRKMIRDMFEWLIDPCLGKWTNTDDFPLYTLMNVHIELFPPFLDFLRHECQVFVGTSGIHLTRSLMKLYSSLMEEIKVYVHVLKDNLEEYSMQCTKPHKEMLILYSQGTFMGTYNAHVHAQLHDYLVN